MKRTMLLAIAAMTILAAAPAGAVVDAYAWAERTHLIEAYQSDGAPVEVRLFGATSTVVDADPYGEPFEDGGCVYLFRASPDGDVADEACGALAIHPLPLLAGTHIVGTLHGSAYGYVNDPEHGPTFTETGPSTIEVDLTLTGSGDIRLAEPEGTSVGVCGLPIVQGASASVYAPLTRPATASGTLRGTASGSVEGSTLWGQLTEYAFAYAGACLAI